MSVGDLPLLSALKMKMRWHEGRQRVLAENVANADTPDYKARDLKAPRFADLVGGGRSDARMAPMRTNGAHLGVAGAAGGEFKTLRNTDWEITPEGNGVVLEEQMMKVAENQMDYQMATTLYGKSLGLIRTALGRR